MIRRESSRTTSSSPPCAAQVSRCPSARGEHVLRPRSAWPPRPGRTRARPSALQRAQLVRVGRACRRAICTARASRSAVTVADTRTSVSVTACTTGSTTGVVGSTEEPKTGGRRHAGTRRRRAARSCPTGRSRGCRRRGSRRGCARCRTRRPVAATPRRRTRRSSRGLRAVELVEESGQQHDHARRHLDAHGRVEQRQRATRQHRAEGARRQHVGQEPPPASAARPVAAKTAVPTASPATNTRNGRTRSSARQRPAR